MLENEPFHRAVTVHHPEPYTLFHLSCPLIYPANDIRSDGRPRRIRCYGGASNDPEFAQCEQLRRRQLVTRRPNAGAGGGCWQQTRRHHHLTAVFTLLLYPDFLPSPLMLP
jgi:hypothetical protein